MNLLCKFGFHKYQIKDLGLINIFGTHRLFLECLRCGDSKFEDNDYYEDEQAFKHVMEIFGKNGFVNHVCNKYKNK